jgi:hypothetical protein
VETRDRASNSRSHTATQSEMEAHVGGRLQWASAASAGGRSGHLRLISGPVAHIARMIDRTTPPGSIDTVGTRMSGGTSMRPDFTQ